MLHVKDCFSRLLRAAAEADLSGDTQTNTLSHERLHTYSHSLILHVHEQARKPDPMLIGALLCIYFQNIWNGTYVSH